MTDPLHTLTERVRDAAAHHTPLRIRGGGSKDFYGTPHGELLETSAYTGITSYEPSELVVTVRAGTPLAELEATLADKGQCLAFEPPHFDAPNGLAGGTCGGMVAAGLSGPARASVGSLRDYVLGVQLLNGRAEHLSFGGQVMKNVAGYDLSRLMVGAMGTLGLLTDISLKVLPVAPAEATLVFDIDQPGALAQLHRWGAKPLPLNASCWVQDTNAPHSPELLFVRLRGAMAAVESACSQMLADLPGQRMDNTQAIPDWAACRDQKLPFFTQPPGATEALALWRLSLPQTAPALNLPWPQLVEWHGGQRWLWAPESASTLLRQTAKASGGSASLFIATNDDTTSTTGRFDALNLATEQIHRRLKTEFDPAGIFNPGRLYPSL